MKYAILLDFGSTYTKIVCVDIESQVVVLTDKFPSTVHTDARIAMNQCFKSVLRVIDRQSFNEALKLASSSAAGGLRIAVSSLTKSLSLKAGRNASFGAGGKVVCSFSGKLAEDDIENIENSKAEIILLCGGYEGGNSNLVLHNAEVISKSKLNIPIVYAGNSYVSADVRRLCLVNGKECFVAENIAPDVGVLNIESTVDIMRNLFMSRITNMKGIGTIKHSTDGPIIPTPAAVLAAGELLYKGTSNERGIGPYMMIDIGGATTDVYSFTDNGTYKGAKFVGLPEPEIKRTVEGDLGMRESSMTLVNEVGKSKFASLCEITEETLEKGILKRLDEREYIASDPIEEELDKKLAEYAVKLSSIRHAGEITREFVGGCNIVQRGKNLTKIERVIGTGGILINSSVETAEKILKQVQEAKEEILLPKSVGVLIDRDYIMFAAGLLANEYKDVALAIMKKSIELEDKEKS